MEHRGDNLILIGMPGCGKSTVGVVLAKTLGYDFLDTDLLIQAREKRILPDILEQEGRDAFNRIEEEALLTVRAERTVIATGGSAVYGRRAMEHLRGLGTVVYLRLPLENVSARLGDLKKRGVSLAPGQTLRELYEERVPLYEKYADVILDADGLDIPGAAAAIGALTVRRG